MSKIIEDFLNFNEEQKNFIKKIIKDYEYDSIHFYENDIFTSILYNKSYDLFKYNFKDYNYIEDYKDIVYSRDVQFIEKIESGVLSTYEIDHKYITVKHIVFKNLQEIKKYIEITEAQKEIEEIMNIKPSNKKRSRL